MLKNQKEEWFLTISKAYKDQATVTPTHPNSKQNQSLQIKLPCGCVQTEHMDIKSIFRTTSKERNFFEFCSIHKYDFSAEIQKPVEPIAHSKDKNGVRLGTTQAAYDQQMNEYYDFIITHKK